MYFLDLLEILICANYMKSYYTLLTLLAKITSRQAKALNIYTVPSQLAVAIST